MSNTSIDRGSRTLDVDQLNVPPTSIGYLSIDEEAALVSNVFLSVLQKAFEGREMAGYVKTTWEGLNGGAFLSCAAKVCEPSRKMLGLPIWPGREIAKISVEGSASGRCGLQIGGIIISLKDPQLKSECAGIKDDVVQELRARGLGGWVSKFTEPKFAGE
jgi:hypothetical protein